MCAREVCAVRLQVDSPLLPDPISLGISPRACTILSKLLLLLLLLPCDSKSKSTLLLFLPCDSKSKPTPPPFAFCRVSVWPSLRHDFCLWLVLLNHGAAERRRLKLVVTAMRKAKSKFLSRRPKEGGERRGFLMDYAWNGLVPLRWNLKSGKSPLSLPGFHALSGLVLGGLVLGGPGWCCPFYCSFFY